MEVEQKQPALPLRPHTIFGVCEAIGEDFGFNPIFLRVPFAAGVLISPTMAIGAYLLVGLFVLASRLLFPNPKTVGQMAEPQANAETSVANDKAEEKLPLAA